MVVRDQLKNFLLIELITAVRLQESLRLLKVKRQRTRINLFNKRKKGSHDRCGGNEKTFGFGFY